MTASDDKVGFDGWTLTKSTGDLSKAGVVTRLQQQPLQVLVELVDRSGELVTREQLIAKLWPKGIVEFDTSLNTAVRKLRVALNDDPDHPRYIETIPRRGYRFLMPVDVLATSAPSPAAALTTPRPVGAPPSEPLPVSVARIAPTKRSRALVGGLCVLAVIAACAAWYFPRAVTPSLVVLPFVDMTTEQKDAALCNGITEELIGRLSKLQNVDVVARTSSFAYQGKTQDVRAIGKTLGVTHAIEGSVRRDGGALRVTVQLVSSADGMHFYSDTFDFVQADIFDVQQTIAQAVSQEMRVWFSPEMIERWQSGGSSGREAFDFYVRARRYRHKHTPDADDQAAELFQMAIDRDPKFALAYLGLAEVLLSTISGREVPVDKIAGRVREYVERAEKISPELPEIESTRGWLAFESNELSEAVTHFKAAIARNPNDATSHSRLGIVYGLLAQPRDALQAQTRAAELDPHDFISPMYLCIQLQELGQFDEASRACARSRQLAPESAWGPLVTSWLEDGRGDLPEAIRWTNEAIKLEPSNASIVFSQIDLLLTLNLIEPARAAATRLGTTDEARARLIQASLALAEHGQAGLKNYLENVSIDSVDEPATRMEAVRVYHTVGDVTRARETLAKVIDAPEFNEADLYKTESIRSGFSPAIIVGGALLAAGERDRAAKVLQGLEALLDRLENNGWATYGIDSLRAESLALQGDGDGAMRSLRRAVDRGWRGAWRAREEPYLASLRGRRDFLELLQDVEARNASMRARYLELSAVQAKAAAADPAP